MYESLPDGRKLGYTINKKGKRRYVVSNDEDKVILKAILSHQRQEHIKRWRTRRPGQSAKYQRKVRRKTVVKRHYPWLQPEQIEALVQMALNEDGEYKKNPDAYLAKGVVRLGFVACCPTCGRGATADNLVPVKGASDELE